MDGEELYEREHDFLRDELHNLKTCQVSFLTFAVTATGLLLGFMAKQKSDPVGGVVYLVPLVILLPTWSIFFDKARTIYRIVGYYRILERLILAQSAVGGKFLGWENALARFRDLERHGKLQPPLPCETWLSRAWWLIKAPLFGIQSYPMLVYVTFLSLSVVCWGLSYSAGKGPWDWVIWLAGALILLSAVLNLIAVWHLTNGRHTYDANEYYWERVLEITSSASTAKNRTSQSPPPPPPASRCSPPRFRPQT